MMNWQKSLMKGNEQTLDICPVFVFFWTDILPFKENWTDFHGMSSLFPELDTHLTSVQFLHFFGHTPLFLNKNGHTFAVCPVFC